jgi:hypothetical protein
MVGLLRRLYPRHDTNLEVAIGIIDRNTLSQSAVTKRATLVNVSSGGCCIVVESPLVGTDHLFYKTLHSDRYSLCICLPDTNRQEQLLRAQPIWMDGCTFADRHAFKIGMQFVNKQTDLSIFLAANQQR